MVRFLAAFFLPGLLAIGPSPDAVRWRTEIDGPARRDDHALAVALDPGGDVVAAGDIVTTGDLSDLAVVKTDAQTGERIWQTTVPGTGDSFSSGAEAVAIDGGGTVYAAGAVDTQASFLDFSVVALEGATGTVRWTVNLNGGPFDNERANDVAVDGRGGVIAGGYVVRAGTQRFTVVKLDAATGSVTWRRELGGTLPFRTQANALTVEADGDVIAAGSIAKSGSAEDLVVVELDGDTGNVGWRVDIDGTGHYQDEATDLVLDSAGDVVVSGFIFGAGSVQDFAVLKVDSETGDVIWQRTLDGDAHWADIAEAVAVDSSGDVVVGGTIFNRNEFWGDFSVAKFDGATGDLLWRREKGSQGTSTAHAVAITPGGDVVAAGEIPRPATKTEFTVVALDGGTGRPARAVGLNGTDDWFDVAYDIAVVGSRVVAAGWFVNQDGGSDFGLVRLN